MTLHRRCYLITIHPLSSWNKFAAILCSEAHPLGEGGVAGYWHYNTNNPHRPRPQHQPTKKKKKKKKKKTRKIITPKVYHQKL